MKLELVSIPVSDQDKALELYEKIGFSKIRDARANAHAPALIARARMHHLVIFSAAYFPDRVALSIL
jgi:hypothetical protein